MEKPIDIVEERIYIEPNSFNNDSECELFYNYLESRKYIEWLESELKKLRVGDVSESVCKKCGADFMPRLFKELTICDRCHDKLLQNVH